MCAWANANGSMWPRVGAFSRPTMAARRCLCIRWVTHTYIHIYKEWSQLYSPAECHTNVRLSFAGRAGGGGIRVPAHRTWFGGDTCLRQTGRELSRQHLSPAHVSYSKSFLHSNSSNPFPSSPSSLAIARLAACAATIAANSPITLPRSVHRDRSLSAAIAAAAKTIYMPIARIAMW